MDVTPSRVVSFALQAEETMSDDEILIDDCQHGRETDRSEIVAGMEVGLESGYSNTDDVEPGSPRNDGVDKVKTGIFHREVCEMGARCFLELCFAAVEDSSGNSTVMITQRTLNLHPLFGYMSRIQVSISGFQYKVHVMMKKWDSGVLDSIADLLELCRKFSADSDYKFCPGIDPQHYKLYYYEMIRFDLKSVRQTIEPFVRVDSVNCKLWFTFANNATIAEKSSRELRCSACKRLVTDLDCQRRRTLAESPG